MLPNFKAYLTCALCVLSTLCLTAAGDRDNSDGVYIPHSLILTQKNETTHFAKDNPAIHPRSDTVPWSSHRTLTLGIGPQGQNIGTQTRWSDKDNSYFLHDNIKNAIDKLCKKDGFGFDQCDGEDEYRVSVVAVKDKDGNMVRDGVFKVKVGSSYWPYGHGGLREVLVCSVLLYFVLLLRWSALWKGHFTREKIANAWCERLQRDAAAWTMQTVAENNCWKPGFNGKEQDTEICMAPDKIMLRVDDLAWLVVFLFRKYPTPFPFLLPFPHPYSTLNPT